MHQQCMEGVASSLPGVLVYLDDIVVVEKTGGHSVGCAAPAEGARPIAKVRNAQIIFLKLSRSTAYASAGLHPKEISTILPC